MNNTKTVIFRTEDFYNTMVDWWKAHSFTPVSPSMLPEHTFVIYDGDIPTHSMCFYNTDSNLAWVGWQLRNPNTTKEQSKGKLKQLFAEIEEYSKSLGYHVLFTTSNTPSVEKVMIDNDFIKGDIGVNHYIKTL